jgi:hypothetical protein
MTHQPTFDEIQKQHQEMLGQISINDDVDLDISRVQAFLNTLAQAGTSTEDPEQRSQLHTFIRYWSGIIDDTTGNFSTVELLPFAGKRPTRRTVLAGLAAGLGLTALTAATSGCLPTPATVQLNATATAQANKDATATATVTPRSPFNVYTDADGLRNHYVPSGWMGDVKDITLTENWTANPHSGGTCIRVVYSGSATQGNRWAGVFWQDPMNNWGTVPKPTGYDLRHFSKLSFWIRGQSGGEQIQFYVGGIQGPYGDSLQPQIYAVTDDTNWITLTTSWQLVTINLKGQDLTHIIGAFGWATNKDVNPHGATFYLDDIVYSA